MDRSLTRVQRRQQETRERIFRVALALFREKGFEHTTVAEITEAADIGKGTFFTYFPTKEAVFGHLGAMMVDTMAATLDQELAAGAPVAGAIQQLFTSACDWHEANRWLTQEVVLAVTRSHAAMRADADNQARLLRILEAAMRLGQERGELRPDVLAEDAAVALSGAYFTVIVAWLHDPAQRPVHDRMHATIGLVLRGTLA